MKNIPLDKMINYNKSIKKSSLDKNNIFTSLFGFLIALTIHNMIQLLFNDFIFKIIDANIDKKRIIKIFNAEIDIKKIIELFLKILLISIFIYIFFKFNNILN